jgi:hypothetical protein
MLCAAVMAQGAEQREEVSRMPFPNLDGMRAEALIDMPLGLQPLLCTTGC